jgi:uncharacterized membrane protein
MIDLSLAGIIGAVVGTVIAALVYVRLVGLVERGFRPRGPSASPEERQSFEQERSLLRRTVLALDILVLAGIGYWLGAKLGG